MNILNNNFVQVNAYLLIKQLSLFRSILQRRGLARIEKDEATTMSTNRDRNIHIIEIILIFPL